MIKSLKSPLGLFMLVSGAFAVVAAAHLYNLWQARMANPIAYFQQENPSSAAAVDHSPWQTLLDKYVVEDGSHGYTAFNYDGMSFDDIDTLDAYIQGLAEVEPKTLNKKAQFAYWVNLYNALTVQLIVEDYPVDSIKQIGSKIDLGPWDDVVIEVDGEELTLNNIEHGILRPIFADPRVHYGVNCASLGCPNLSQTAYTAANLDAELDKAATAFINSPKGARFEGETLVLSSIYDWFASDFGGSTAGVLAHLQQYAEPELQKKLKGFNGKIRYEYNWELNEPGAAE